MGANATQGLAVLMFLVAFTFLAAAMFGGGNLMFIVLFLVGAVVSIGLFLKAKAWEHEEK